MGRPGDMDTTAVSQAPTAFPYHPETQLRRNFAYFVLVISQHGFRIQTSGLTYQAWKHFPTTYILCEGDKACPPELQTYVIARAQEQGAQIKVEKFKTDHFPLLSALDKVADVVRRVAINAIVQDR